MALNSLSDGLDYSVQKGSFLTLTETVKKTEKYQKKGKLNIFLGNLVEMDIS